MTTPNVILKLERDNAPSWALGEQTNHYWYYENQYGEQWVAKREADTLHISGSDIDWKEYLLTLDEAKGERERIRIMLVAKALMQTPELGETIAKSFVDAATARQRQFIKLPLAQLILDTSEMYWVAAVLEAAIPSMEWAQEQARKS